MIPLNKPYWISAAGGSSDLLTEHFDGYQASFTYSSRDGLNAVYQHLYATRGPLRVAVSPLACFVALYPIVANGHTPVYVDIDAHTWNMDEKLLAEQDVDVVQVIHLGGNPMDMDAVCGVASAKGWVVIEDCAQALGSQWHNQWVGSFGDYAVFSMVKNLHTKAGGLLLLRYGHSFSLSGGYPSEVTMTYKCIKRWLEAHTSYEAGLVTFLYKKLLQLKEKETDTSFSNQIKLLKERHVAEIRNAFCNFAILQERRKAVATTIIEQLQDSGWMVQSEKAGAQSNRNRLLLLDENRLAKDVIRELRSKGVAANNLTQNYLCGYQEHIAQHKDLGAFYVKPLENYERVLPHLVAVPCSPGMSADETAYVIKTIKSL